LSLASASPTRPTPNPNRDSGIKYQRGSHHFDALETEWQQFTKGFTSALETIATPGEVQMRLGRFSELATRDWSVVVGDCVQNFRAALDHMAWQLSSAQERIARPTRIEFPIFADQARYLVEAPRKIAGVPAAAASVIQSIQPFHRNPAQDQNGHAAHPLWQLQELATIDKHRRLHIGHVSLEAVTLSVGSDRLATIWRAAPPAVRAQQGMLVARVAHAEMARFTSSGRLQVQPGAFLTVVFEDSGTVTGEGVIGTLRRIRDAVADVLVQLEPYIGL
jgi:hypothetical protein